MRVWWAEGTGPGAGPRWRLQGRVPGLLWFLEAAFPDGVAGAPSVSEPCTCSASLLPSASTHQEPALTFGPCGRRAAPLSPEAALPGGRLLGNLVSFPFPRNLDGHRFQSLGRGHLWGTAVLPTTASIHPLPWRAPGPTPGRRVQLPPGLCPPHRPSADSGVSDSACEGTARSGQRSPGSVPSAQVLGQGLAGVNSAQSLCTFVGTHLLGVINVIFDSTAFV